MRKVFLVILLLAIIGVIGYEVLQTTGSPLIPGFEPKLFTVTTPTTTAVTGPIILDAIQNVAQLETVSMVFANDQDLTRVWGLQSACREGMTYLGYYTVTAGVDLRQITSQNIQVDTTESGKNPAITITLPEASIMHVELDTQRSRVVHHDVSLLSQICGTQLPEMVTEAQANLQKISEQAALQKEILGMAQDRASFELQKLLLNMGFSRVTIQ